MTHEEMTKWAVAMFRGKLEENIFAESPLLSLLPKRPPPSRWRRAWNRFSFFGYRLKCAWRAFKMVD